MVTPIRPSFAVRAVFVAVVSVLAVSVSVDALAQSHPGATPAKKSGKSASKKTPRKRTAKPTASAPAPEPPKWPDDSLRTLSETLARLEVVPAKNLKDKDFALKAALEFCIAVGNADGAKSAGLLDAPGFQQLPRDGPLPEQPQRPILPPAVRDQINQRRAARVGNASATSIELVDRDAARKIAPSIGEWMLPADYLAIISPDAQAGDWVRQKCHVVIRMRARRATIAGGDLLDQLPASGPTPSPPNNSTAPPYHG